ncbi:MAG: 5-formyltetrahydrofolate cyclo-ligase [Muribaculaceae bacterium]|nr:5-formyltetrahydrofolate cyclo-ligase [Muribaculaceae bacterium]
MRSKAEIRRAIKAIKESITEDYRRSASDAIISAVERTDLFRNATSILMYHSLPDEVITHDAIIRWSQQKRIFLPKVIGNDIMVVPYSTSDSMTKGAFNILEPSGSDSIDVNSIDLIIVPAVALSPTGGRIGRGKGYYDRLLASCNRPKLGIIYQFQLCKPFETETHDVSIDYIITEKSFITTSKPHEL